MPTSQWGVTNLPHDIEPFLRRGIAERASWFCLYVSHKGSNLGVGGGPMIVRVSTEVVTGHGSMFTVWSYALVREK